MTTTSINYFHSLRLREICDTCSSRKLPNIFRDYHLQAYDPVVYGSAPEFVIAGDIIFVICKSFYLLPFRLDEEFSPLTDDRGSQIIITMRIKYACHNSNNNSLIIVAIDRESDWISIVSMEIESIKAGRTTEQRNICPQDGKILNWEFGY
jgi:hypothetical protein